MHLPRNSIVPFSGKKARKNAKKPLQEAVQISNQDGCLKEFGVSESENAVQSFVCVSPGDILTLNFAIPIDIDIDGDEQIIDLVVDGVLRATSVKKRNLHLHRGDFMDVYHYPNVNGQRDKLHRCDMIVQERATDKGM